MKKEQVITVSEYLATAAVIGAGFAIGGPIGASVVTGIGINLSSSVIDNNYRGLKNRWLSRDGVLNHDIQHALTRAYIKALTQIEEKYFALPYSQALPDHKKKSIKNLFTYLKERAYDQFIPSIEKAALAKDVREYLYLEPSQALTSLWETVDAAKVINSKGKHFGDFFRENLLREIQFWFSEELKTDNTECNRAWRAFQRMLLDGIQADVKSVKEAQELVVSDLGKLETLRHRLEEISDVIDRRLPDEPFQKNLEIAVTHFHATLQDIAGTTIRTEQQVNAIAADVRALSSQLFPDGGRKYPELTAKGPKEVLIWQMPDTGSVLFGRDERLKQLHEAWDQPSIKVISLVAPGGIGKSTLINHWLAKLSEDNYRGAERVYAWSFYRQGITDLVVSAYLFIDHALRWFGDADPSKGTLWEKGERLARLIKQNRTLLIIDGLEPLQYPPGPRIGKLKEENVAITALLRDLAAFNPGLCVISTRLSVADLKQFEISTAPKIDLEILSSGAGAQLLAYQGVQGSIDELERASDEFGGHALALTLLGSYLRVVFGGDVRQRGKVSLLVEDDEQGGHAQRVMASYEQWLGDGPELALLRLMGLFDRPISEKIILHLISGKMIEGLTTFLKDLSDEDWRRLVDKLRSVRLFAEQNNEQREILDTHPLIREYFGRRLIRTNFEAWKEGNKRLYEYYRDAAPDFPITIREMDTLFLAGIHGCKAGKHKDVLEQVYIPRIMRGEEAYAANKLGAIGALLSLLAYFFEKGDWRRPVETLDPTYQLFILTEAGRYLTEVKGYSAAEVGQCYEKAKIVCIEIEDKRGLFEVMLGMCRYHRLREELCRSGELATELLMLGEELDDETLLPAAQRALATNYFYLGNFTKAKEHAELGAVTYSDLKQALTNAQLDVNEPAISCLGYSALTLWFLGYPDQSRSKCNEALTRARELGHAHTLAITLLIDTMVNHLRRDTRATYESAQNLINICAEQGFLLWRIAGEILKAWATTRLDNNVGEASERIQQSITAWLETEAKLFTPYWYAILADTCMVKGEADKCRTAILHGMQRSEESGEHWWDAELYRLQGELTLATPDSSAAREDYFSKAINVARAQHANSLELRAAMSLAKLLMMQERREIAYKLLVDAYAKFDEGFETADLREAEDLLEELKVN